MILIFIIRDSELNFMKKIKTYIITYLLSRIHIRCTNGTKSPIVVVSHFILYHECTRVFFACHAGRVDVITEHY